MNTNFNPDLVDSDYISQSDEFINPEYAKQEQEEKLKELQLLEALKQRQRMKQYPKGTDMYYESREPNLENVKDLDIWDLLGD